MECHKGSLFQKRTERERAGVRQGEEKNGTARGSKQIKNNFPTLSKKKEKTKGEKDENGSGAPAPARVLMISSVCFEREPFSEGSNNPADMRKFLNAL